MEKIKLLNGKVFNLIPMGIDTNLFAKKRTFVFISELKYSEIEAEFEKENISKIEYLTQENHVLKTYEDCITLRRLGKEFERQINDNYISDVYVVELGLITQ